MANPGQECLRKITNGVQEERWGGAEVKGGSNNVGEVGNEFLVEVGKTGEELYCFDRGRGVPGSDDIEFLWIHCNSSLTNNHF